MSPKIKKEKQDKKEYQRIKKVIKDGYSEVSRSLKRNSNRSTASSDGYTEASCKYYL